MIGRAKARPAGEHLTRLRERVGTLDRHADRLLAELSEADLVWRPADGWSVAQVFEHLRLLNETYLAPMRTAVREAERREQPGGATGDASARRPNGGGFWRPTLLGRLLAGTSGPETRMRVPSPPRFRPEPDPRPDAATAYRRQLAELARILMEAGDLDLGRTRVPWPFFRWLRINLGDAFELVVGHAERHMAQVNRILERPERPRAAEGPRPPSWPPASGEASR